MAENAITIRRVAREEVAEVVRLLADDVLGGPREEYKVPLPDYYYRAFEEISQNPDNMLMVAEQSGKIIGTFQLVFVPNMGFRGNTRALVEGVRVDPSCRGQGIGALMMEWVKEAAKKRGCQFIELTTHKSRVDAHRFYEKLGFVTSHLGMKLML